MIQEAIEAIKELVEANEIKIDLTKDHYLLRQPNGEYVMGFKPVERLQPLQVWALDIESLVKTLKTTRTDYQICSVFINQENVVAICQSSESDSAERWKHTLLLPLHPAFKTLNGWLERKTFSQLELLRILRSQFKGFINKDIIDILSVLKVETKTNAQSAATPDYSKLGRDIEAQVRTATGQNVPTELVFEVPVYDIPDTRDERYRIEVLLHIDPLEGDKISVTTVHNDLKEAQYLAMGSVAEQVRQVLADDDHGNDVAFSDVPVLLGLVNTSKLSGN
jgi:hypothetical protein